MMDRPSEISDEMKRIYHEMDPVFLAFMMNIKTVAVGTGMAQMFLYGDDPDDIDHCVVVFALPSGAIGFGVNEKANKDVVFAYIKSLLGPTYFAQAESHITVGPPAVEMTEDNVDEVLDRLKETIKQHMRECDKHAAPKQEELPLPEWVVSVMEQEENADA